MKYFRKAFTILFITITSIVANSGVLYAAGNFSVSPLIVDVDAEARDSFTETISITSHKSNHQRLYASVHEIKVDEGGALKEFIPASMSDRAISITSWVEITRSRIDLQSGETKEIPLVIRVNHNTPSGKYHAFVGFAAASNSDEAVKLIESGQGQGVILRIDVGSKPQEFLKLVSFTTDRLSMFSNKGQLSYVLENTGDAPLTPQGDVIIYDNRGRELAVLGVNDNEVVTLAPGEIREFSESLPFINRLGRHKAFLTVEYGEINRAAVYDTNFYLSLPWFYLVAVMLLLSTLLVVLVLWFRRTRTFDDYELPEDGHEVPLYVGRTREHTSYEHDINLKQNNNSNPS
jgi:hypothetical protein